MTYRARKPRVVFLADRPNWAFDFTARSIGLRLADRFACSHKYVWQQPDFSPADVDLLYVFFWGEQWYKRFGIPPLKIVKEVASFRWREEAYGRLSPGELAARHLSDAVAVTTPALGLWEELEGTRDDVYLCPNGFEPGIFWPPGTKKGEMRIGWAGNPNDDSKGLRDILIPACEGKFRFDFTPGNWSRRRVAHFYRQVDVLAIASVAESQPLPLIEALACGCFPVVTDVGIVPEIVRSGENGLVVERSVEGFREAFDWCQRHLDQVRQAGHANAQQMQRTRSWDCLASRFGEIFDYALGCQGSCRPAKPAAIPTTGNRPVNDATVSCRWWMARDAWAGRHVHFARLRRAVLSAASRPARLILKSLLPRAWRAAIHRRVR